MSTYRNATPFVRIAAAAALMAAALSVQAVMCADRSGPSSPQALAGIDWPSVAARAAARPAAPDIDWPAAPPPRPAAGAAGAEVGGAGSRLAAVAVIDWP
ncbi:hypothetical protein [Streptomyces olivaceoviridis]|uniref:hypothetical protein n=1 Tax=Streptomyces olivaceoviridis TaxID=1921 RepID=UPI0036FCB215